MFSGTVQHPSEMGRQCYKPCILGRWTCVTNYFIQPHAYLLTENFQCWWSWHHFDFNSAWWYKALYCKQTVLWTAIFRHASNKSHKLLSVVYNVRNSTCRNQHCWSESEKVKQIRHKEFNFNHPATHTTNWFY